MSNYKYPTCKGSYFFGSACGNCERCTEDRQRMNGSASAGLVPLTKDEIIEFVRQKRDAASGAEHSYYCAIYFVLRNRTEDNWGPKELTMDVAMRLP